ncbi:MAG: alpha/beta hydrolase [Eubacteriales bacterium]|jgi:acetyl esterase/lipase
MSLIYEFASLAAAKAARITLDLNRRKSPPRVAAVSYGPNKDQQITIYFPKKRRYKPAVLYWSGSGFLGCTGDERAAAHKFNRLGWVFIACGCRHMPLHPFPAQIEDAFHSAEAALGFMQDTGMGKEIICAGSSSGALLAANVALDSLTRASFGIEADIKGLLSVGGILDAEHFFTRMNSVRRGIISAVSRSSIREIMTFSPITMIDEDTDVPVLCIHGKYDHITPYANAMRFIRRLNGITCRRLGSMIEIDDVIYRHFRLTHGLWIEDPSRSRIQREIFRWLGTLG